MKLLFDQNLSHRLVDQFADAFPGSAHVRPLGLDQASDQHIWDYAIANQFCIVTKDADFIERSRLYGAPPKIIRLCCGNATPDQVQSIIRHHLDVIAELAQNPDLHFAEIG